MTQSLPSARSRTSALLAVLGVLLIVAGCGASSGSDPGGVVSLASPSPSAGASGGPGASQDPEEAMAAFSACMKEHGVDIQVSTVNGAGQGGASVNISGSATAPGGKAGAPQAGVIPQDAKSLEEADRACRHLLPSGQLGDPSATIPPEQVEAMLGFAKCMREHGIDFPDPQFNGGGMTVQVGGPDGQAGVDPSSATFQAAQEACAKAMPSGAPFVMGGTSSQGSGPATQAQP